MPCGVACEERTGATVFVGPPQPDQKDGTEVIPASPQREYYLAVAPPELTPRRFRPLRGRSSRPGLKKNSRHLETKPDSPIRWG